MRGRASVDGERAASGVADVAAAAPRPQRHIALAVVGTLGAGVLGWYYHHLSTVPADTSARERARQRPAVNSEMKLPTLEWRTSPAEQPSASDRTAVTRPPAAMGRPAALAADDAPFPPERGARRETAPVLLHGTAVPQPDMIATRMANLAPLPDAGLVASVEGGAPSAAGQRRRTLADSLVPTLTEPTQALLVPTQRWLLPKGAFIDCTLETAIDSSLPGMATCVLAADVFGADGRVVLLERGSRLVGETQTDVGATQARVAVLWSEVRTPTGVVVRLASPATDALGGSGVPGAVDRHLGARFGAAVLLSLINGGMSAAVAHQQGSAGVVYNVQGSQEVGAEALRGTIGIMPTIRVLPGARVQVLVARDVDFRAVYRLVHSGDG
jgi:type IV secretion system protein VirB10